MATHIITREIHRYWFLVPLGIVLFAFLRVTIILLRHSHDERR